MLLAGMYGYLEQEQGTYIWKEKPSKNWTNEDMTNLRRHLRYYINNKKMPSPAVCKKFVEVYSDCGKLPREVYTRGIRLVQEAMAMEQEQEQANNDLMIL